MKTRMAKWGNSIAVRVPKALADELGLTPGQVVDFQRRGTRLEIETRPAGAEIPYYRIEDLVAEMKRLGPENEPPLEDWGILPSEWPEEDWSDLAPKDDDGSKVGRGRS